MGELERLQLMHLCSNVFPTGIFTHSFGYEGMLEAGLAKDLSSYQNYLSAVLKTGSGKADTALVRFAYEQPKRLAEWDELCTALKPSRELRMASSRTGKAFVKAFIKMYPGTLLDQEELENSNYAVVFGYACRYLEISLPAALEAYLTGTLLSYVQVAIKLIPLSQIDGQVVMKNLYPEILQCIKEVMEMEEEDIFSFTPMLDIASMNHEMQESRMYMS